MLSKAKIKFVQSLKDKKHRKEHGLFAVEGNKTVQELLRSKIQVKTLFATGEWLTHNSQLVLPAVEIIETDKEGIKKIAFTQTPQDVLALALLPQQDNKVPDLVSDFTIALDTIQDPGNLGTIMRIADWYGIKQIICSPGCADVFSPKVIQATMGSFIRVNVAEMELEQLFEANKGVPVYGALMNGKSLYDTKLRNGILLIGNEGNGIHEDLIKYITHPVTIPKVGGAESLNAAVATAVICDARARMAMRE